MISLADMKRIGSLGFLALFHSQTLSSQQVKDQDIWSFNVQAVNMRKQDKKADKYQSDEKCDDINNEQKYPQSESDDVDKENKRPEKRDNVKAEENEDDEDKQKQPTQTARERVIELLTHAQSRQGPQVVWVNQGVERDLKHQYNDFKSAQFTIQQQCQPQIMALGSASGFKLPVTMVLLDKKFAEDAEHRRYKYGNDKPQVIVADRRFDDVTEREGGELGITQSLDQNDQTFKIYQHKNFRIVTVATYDDDYSPKNQRSQKRPEKRLLFDNHKNFDLNNIGNKIAKNGGIFIDGSGFSGIRQVFQPQEILNSKTQSEDKVERLNFLGRNFHQLPDNLKGLRDMFGDEDFRGMVTMQLSVDFEYDDDEKTNVDDDEKTDAEDLTSTSTSFHNRLFVRVKNDDIEIPGWRGDRQSCSALRRRGRCMQNTKALPLPFIIQTVGSTQRLRLAPWALQPHVNHTSDSKYFDKKCSHQFHDQSDISSTNSKQKLRVMFSKFQQRHGGKNSVILSKLAKQQKQIRPLAYLNEAIINLVLSFFKNKVKEEQFIKKLQQRLQLNSGKAKAADILDEVFRNQQMQQRMDANWGNDISQYLNSNEYIGAKSGKTATAKQQFYNRIRQWRTSLMNPYQLDLGKISTIKVNDGPIQVLTSSTSRSSGDAVDEKSDDDEPKEDKKEVVESRVIALRESQKVKYFLQ